MVTVTTTATIANNSCWLLDIGAEVDVIGENFDLLSSSASSSSSTGTSSGQSSSGQLSENGQSVSPPKVSPVGHQVVPCPSDFLQIDLQEFDPTVTLRFDHKNGNFTPSPNPQPISKGHEVTCSNKEEENVSSKRTRLSHGIGPLLKFSLNHLTNHVDPTPHNYSLHMDPRPPPPPPRSPQVDLSARPPADPAKIPQPITPIRGQQRAKNLVHPSNCPCVVAMPIKNCVQCAHQVGGHNQLKLNTEDKILRCSICNRGHQTEADLTRHLQLHIVGPPSTTLRHDSQTVNVNCPMYFLDPISNSCVPSSWICHDMACSYPPANNKCPIIFNGRAQNPPNFNFSRRTAMLKNGDKNQSGVNSQKIQNQPPPPPPATRRPPRCQRPIKLTIDPELLKKEVVFRCQICGLECRDWAVAAKHARAQH